MYIHIHIHDKQHPAWETTLARCRPTPEPAPELYIIDIVLNYQ